MRRSPEVNATCSGCDYKVILTSPIAVGRDIKGKVPIATYVAEILPSFTNRWPGFGLGWVVALI